MSGFLQKKLYYAKVEKTSKAGCGHWTETRDVMKKLMFGWMCVKLRRMKKTLTFQLQPSTDTDSKV